MSVPIGQPDPSAAEDFAREALLIERLRADLPRDAQERFFQEFDHLLTIAAEPRCAEAQADGVPCATGESDCEACGRALAWLERLRAQIAKTAP